MKKMDNKLHFVAIIPARYASTRFPGKPLALLGGKPVIQRVYEQVSAVVEDAVVMGNAVIKAGAQVKHCIVAEDAVIGENAIVGAMPEGDVKGVATIGPGVCVGANAKIGPNAMVKENVKEGEEQC